MAGPSRVLENLMKEEHAAILIEEMHNRKEMDKKCEARREAEFEATKIRLKSSKVDPNKPTRHQKKSVLIQELENTIDTEPDGLSRLQKFHKLKKGFTYSENYPFEYNGTRPPLMEMKDNTDLSLDTYIKSQTSKYITGSGFFSIAFSDVLNIVDLKEAIKSAKLQESTIPVVVTQHYIKNKESKDGSSAFYIKTTHEESSHDEATSAEKEAHKQLKKSIDAGFKFLATYFEKLGTVEQCFFCHDTSLTKNRDTAIQSFLENTIIVKENGFEKTTSELRDIINEAKVFNNDYDEDDDDEEDDDGAKNITITHKLLMSSVILPNGNTMMILRNKTKSFSSILQSVQTRFRLKSFSKFIKPKITNASIYIGDLLYQGEVIFHPFRKSTYRMEYKRFNGTDKLDERVLGGPRLDAARSLAKFKTALRLNHDENNIRDNSDFWRRYAPENLDEKDSNLYQGDDLTFNIVSDSPYLRVFSTRPLTKVTVDEAMCKLEQKRTVSEQDVEEYINQELETDGEYQYMIVGKGFDKVSERHEDLINVEYMASTHLCQNCDNILNFDKDREIETESIREMYEEFLISAKNIELDAFCYKTTQPKSTSEDADDALLSRIMGGSNSRQGKSSKSNINGACKLIEEDDEYKLWQKKNLKLRLVAFDSNLPGKHEDDYMLVISEPTLSLQKLYETIVSSVLKAHKLAKIDTWRFTSGMHRIFSALKARRDFRYYDSETFEDPREPVDSTEYLENFKNRFENYWDKRGAQLPTYEYQIYMRKYRPKFVYELAPSSSLNYHFPRPGVITKQMRNGRVLTPTPVLDAKKEEKIRGKMIAT